MRKNILRLFLFPLAVLSVTILFLPSNAYAYIDPGAGSTLFQLIIGAVLGAGWGLRVLIQKLLQKKNDRKKDK